jgi:hypothetical protein
MKQEKEEANVFSIFVSYYVKIKCVISGIPMVGKFSVKLPFVLIQPSHIVEQSDAPSPTADLRTRIRAVTTARDAAVVSSSAESTRTTGTDEAISGEKSGLKRRSSSAVINVMPSLFILTKE